ncbi:hypothetical protein [Flavivirga eckloniae]|uniref:Uncharacterized protein n=1 Tax=Flavivirga eckloniae TaxID=1803846 RepID=A0A2K9PP71_9FLAO|nr:hypothetical protein [Flavivirga eckloniae]AUP78835.1 hypothetical protein C1H87_09035 [Flavivirga eckloniae]
MDTSDWIAFGAAFLSLIALGLSGIAIWKTHYSKFSPILTVGYCTFRIYPIKNENDKWYIPSFDIPISLTNSGAQIGKIIDLRLKITFPDLPIPNHYEHFGAKWVVEGSELSDERFTWINKASTEKWIPIVLLANQTKTTHLVFESFRWEDPVIQKKMKCTLEIKTDKEDKYQEIDHWSYDLTTRTWYSLAEEGRAHLCSSELTKEKEEYIHPKDLHKYTSTKDEIKEPEKKSAPSYLDYKK